MQRKRTFLILFILVLTSFQMSAQTIYEYSNKNVTVLFFNKAVSEHIPGIVRKFDDARLIHNQIWQIDTTGKGAIKPPMLMISDFGDDGNGGACCIPTNFISAEMSPPNFSYFIAPAPERYFTLFRHEYTHIVTTDKTSKADRGWRTFLGGKFTVESSHPFSALWSCLSAPRWYTPRWYQESAACFMETWLCGGVGRALGGYDEMYFRSIVDSGSKLFSVVGLETEGTASDFQLGTNSYLYGTRFINYLEYKHGLEKTLAFYNRTEDSKALINKQFKKVFNEGLRQEWDNWREFEVKHQKEQLAAIEEYPLTQTKKLTDAAMGSMSPIALDQENGCAYYAANYPGDFAHIERMDLKTLERKRLHTIDGPMLYQTCYLTMDKKRQRLIWTTQNGKYRGIRVYDIAKKKIVQKLNFQRCSELTYDNTGDCMYAILTSSGGVHLVRYEADFKKREIVYSFPFGVSVFDLDISHNGALLSATISGSNGEQELICFDIKGLQNADLSYQRLYTMEDSNLGQFRFAPGDSVMVGSSYYTGVSNIWSLNLRTKELELLSNTKIGLFSPQVTDEGDIIALEFERNGMRPVRFKKEVLHDANSIEMLGQKAYLAHSEELEKLGSIQPGEEQLSFAQVYDSIKVYKPISRLKFTGAYPELSGFRDKQAWNRVTPVLGYRFTFQDPLGINSLKMSVGLSPWSHNDPVNQYHAQLEWNFWNWKFNAAWNPTSFYDLFGPLQSSRKGWMVGVEYQGKSSLLPPTVHEYGASIAAFGMMDALPLYQEITADITSFQTADVFYKFSKTRTSLGGVTAESGISTGAEVYTYLAEGKFYPSINANFDAGLRIPGLKHTSLWLRSAVGQNFGDPESSFGNDYFGGFRNNWVDYRPANRYRRISAFPGVKVDQIQAHSFAKLMADLNLTPIRFNDFGFINLYPTYTQFSVFSTALATDPWARQSSGADCLGYFNVGIQMNTEIVLFKFLKTTWSFGYARAFLPDGTNCGDFLFSLKLL